MSWHSLAPDPDTGNTPYTWVASTGNEDFLTTIVYADHSFTDGIGNLETK